MIDHNQHEVSWRDMQLTLMLKDDMETFITNDRLNQATDVHPHLACSDKSLSGLTATLSFLQPLVSHCNMFELPKDVQLP